MDRKIASYFWLWNVSLIEIIDVDNLTASDNVVDVIQQTSIRQSHDVLIQSDKGATAPLQSSN